MATPLAILEKICCRENRDSVKKSEFTQRAVSAAILSPIFHLYGCTHSQKLL